MMDKETEKIIDEIKCLSRNVTMYEDSIYSAMNNLKNVMLAFQFNVGRLIGRMDKVSDKERHQGGNLKRQENAM